MGGQGSVRDAGAFILSRDKKLAFLTGIR